MYRQRSKKGEHDGHLQEYVTGDKLDPADWREWNVAQGRSGRAIRYLGYRSQGQPSTRPYYAVSVAARSPDGRDSHGFVKLSSGALRYSRFFRSDSHYRVLNNRILTLPRGASNYFGVIDSDSREEDPGLTQDLFGGTIDELLTVATAFGKVCGRRHEYAGLPRVTFSNSRENKCEITGCLIPRQFPYIAFAQSQYEWGHVSLFGFYRLLGLTCSSDRDSPIHAALLAEGVDPNSLDRFIEAGRMYGWPIRFGDHLE